MLYGIFSGEDHVLYASDWPNSDHHATYEENHLHRAQLRRGQGDRCFGEVLLEELRSRLSLASTRSGSAEIGCLRVGWEDRLNDPWHG